MITEARSILRWREGEFSATDDEVILEVPMTLIVNGRELMTLMGLGVSPEELAVGFLRSEGFLSRREQLKSVSSEGGRISLEAEIDLDLLVKLSEKRTITSGCGKGSVFFNPLDGLSLRPVESPAVFTPAEVLARMADLEGRSELFQRTGGVHNAALCLPDRVVVMRSDIGRHNAVDMLGGRAFLDGLDVSGMGLFVSGRVSSEILRKTASFGVGVLVSRSAPTTLALDYAKALGVTVVGYARGSRFNVYTHPARINQSTLE